ncbi:hypothetical protein ACLE2P_003652 [Providencia stuartii]|uniref:hypothetical protein n=1 Tax=Providencia stuartii TaxID=588 RepID=UPI0013D4B66C|nr:hypothetical protein [Providencia stuartii]
MNIDRVILKLNELNELDPKATYELFSKYVVVNEKVAHSGCFFSGGLTVGVFAMGLLSVINGLIDDGLIAADIDFKNEKIIKFVRFDKRRFL